VICPKCLTIETEGSLRCRKCGAQLYTGLFQKPVETQPLNNGSGGSNRESTGKPNPIALVVFVVAVLLLVLGMAFLELRLQ